MAYYTGIDVSLRSVSICVVDDKGEVCLEAKVAAEIDAIVDRLRRFSGDVKSVGFEAGTLTQYLTYGLQAAGFEDWREDPFSGVTQPLPRSRSSILDRSERSVFAALRTRS